MDFKKRKIGIFPKGIPHYIGQRVEFFSSVVFMKNRWIFYSLHRKKETFKIGKKNLRTIKTSFPEKHKIRIFEKVSPSFSSKMWDFFNYHFIKNRPRKSMWRRSA